MKIDGKYILVWFLTKRSTHRRLRRGPNDFDLEYRFWNQVVSKNFKHTTKPRKFITESQLIPSAVSIVDLAMILF